MLYNYKILYKEGFVINRRGAGVVFCAIAAFLFVARYISAAIVGAKVFSWSLNYVGNTLTTLSVISLLVGIGYLILAEKEVRDECKK